MSRLYSIAISLVTMAAHFLLATALGSVLQSYSSAYAGYFIVMSFRYLYAINIFAFKYANNPDEVEQILRKSLKKEK